MERERSQDISSSSVTTYTRDTQKAQNRFDIDSDVLPQKYFKQWHKKVDIEHCTFLFAEVKLQTINDFLFSAQLDNMNLFKVSDQEVKFQEHTLYLVKSWH